MDCPEGYNKCPNDNKKCYKDIIDCVPLEIKCDNPEDSKTKIFKCKNSNKCVESLTECETENGYVKCPYMNGQIPEGKADYLCFVPHRMRCEHLFPDYSQFCNDGICRKSKDLQPSQIVCPLGKVLYFDLTCRDSLSQCYTDYPQCDIGKLRCPDQSCVKDQGDCPTLITCPNPNNKVCPDGTCVTNEIFCSPLKICSEDTTFLCLDYSCAKNAESCSHFLLVDMENLFVLT